MTEPPVILSYFAQNVNAEHLEMLDKEANDIQLAWEKNTTIQYIQRRDSLSTPEQIIKDIKYFSKRIVLFHFSGHAGTDELLMNDGSGNPDGIASLLNAHATNLKIVVLNGCSTWKQVDIFFRRGIPIVVATQCAVKDTHAMHFATSFHQTLASRKSIKDAYREAISDVKTPKKLAVLLPESVKEVAVEFRSLNTSEKLDTIWGLYTQKEGISLIDKVDWRFLPFSKTNDFSYDLAYTIDRNKNLKRFGKLFKPKMSFHKNSSLPSHLCQHFLIIGGDSQSPFGLSRKLVYEEITKKHPPEDLYFSCDPNHKETVTNYINLSGSEQNEAMVTNAILEKISGKWNEKEYTNNEQRIVDFLLGFPEKKYVIIVIKIEQEDLTPDVTETIGNFLKQLESVSSKNPSDTSFLFFWNVIYPDYGLPKFLQKRAIRSFINIFRPNPVRKIINLCAPIPIALQPTMKGLGLINEPFRELEVPSYSDINNWLINNIQPFKLYDIKTEKKICQETDVRVLENKIRDIIRELENQL